MKRPFYTALGFVVWKVAKLFVRRKVEALVPPPEILVAAVVIAGAVAGGATLATSSSADEG